MAAPPRHPYVGVHLVLGAWDRLHEEHVRLVPGGGEVRRPRPLPCAGAEAVRQGSEWPFYIGLAGCLFLLGMALYSALSYTGVCA